ncbi:MAG TPA: 5'/3'-nucleotidase SurE [Spirochaetota bacterium]|nr:5'/3'-nucleotidase SurE [Spirochaetota bacterium]HOS39571.1 5'/3'-nucleotidase SurE [Spirochaetota bacterium]HPI21654.1 5'/3'-nucleotidase SurE [Spirochaetota bacterium]HPU88431.1 5'/3'-nucleotidase SurE [Spirochaetota bacterium]
MIILLTNDDGVTAGGINALFRALSERHDVYLIAPNRELSACSSAITIRHPVTLERISDRIYASDGFPADCVNVGMNAGILPRPDLVVSGINHGPNMGSDVYFSGTVAGARMGYIFGAPAIAVSLDRYGDSDRFDDVARFMLEFVAAASPGGAMEHVFLNINYPDLPRGEIAGCAYTTLGHRNYIDSYRRVSGDDREQRLQLVGNIESSGPDDCDVVAVQNGFISITPLGLDCVDYAYLSRAREGAVPCPK